MPRFPRLPALTIALFAAACSGGQVAAQDEKTLPFTVEDKGTFSEPWAMTFLPDGRALITEKAGAIKIWAEGAPVKTVSGGPKVAYGGQGGLGDVVLHPDFANTGFVYFSWVEAEGDLKGAVVGRAKLVNDNLEGLQILWKQEPKVTGGGHFGHRIAFGPDGMMYVSSGERQKFDPAQDLTANLGKVVRLSDTGMIPSDNPFYDQGRIKAQIWSYGIRNPLGLAFDGAGRLWEVEMGPKGGDELNLITKAANYGYPKVSNGSHYSGVPIPDHAPGDGFAAPKVWWNPVISPGGLMIYSGKAFPKWQGDAFIAGLSSQALIRIDLDGEKAAKADQWQMGARIREVEQGPDGAIWLLEDGDAARLRKLTPR